MTWPEITKDHRDAVDRVMRSGIFSEGPETEALERELAEWLGVEHCVAVSSGTSAVLLACQAVMADYDAVWAPALSFSGTVWGPVWLDMAVDYLDVDPVTYLAPAKDDGAQLVVHLHGAAADVGEATTVEDCAQAWGTLDRSGRHVGTRNTAAWSFNGNKTLWAGEGGAVTCASRLEADFIRSLRRFGEVPGTHNGASNLPWSFNHKITEMSAALARAGLLHLNRWIKQAQEAAFLMCTELVDCELLDPPLWEPSHSWHKFRVRVRDGYDVATTLVRLDQVGVPAYRWQTSPLPEHPGLRVLGEDPDRYPNAASVLERTICIGGEKSPPCAWSFEDVDRWVAAIRSLT